MQPNINFLADRDVEIVELNETKDSLPKLISASDLSKMELPEIEWVVHDLMPIGLNILAGKPKEGKSVMGMNISLAVSQGGRLFSHFETIKNGVLYLCYEDSLRRLKKRINMMKKIDYLDELPENLYFPLEPHDFPILDKKGLKIIEGYLKRYNNIKLVIVDTLGRGTDPKVYSKGISYNAEYGYNSILHGFAQKKNISMLVIHHTRKAPAESDFDEILGTNGIAGSMDNLYTLKKVNGNYVFHIKGRDIDEKEFRIKQSKETLSWVIEGENQTIKLTEEKKEIVDLLSDAKKKMKTSEIAKALGKKVSNISKHLTQLEIEGLIYRHGYGIYAIYPKEQEQSISGKSSKIQHKQLDLQVLKEESE